MNNSFNLQKTVGQILVDKREELGLLHTEISKELKIKEKYLIALESGNFDLIHSEVFIKGFLRNYSNYLGLNTSRMLKLYKRERVNANEGKTIEKYKSELKKSDKKMPVFFTKYKFILFSIFISVFGILAVFGFRIFVNLNQPNIIIEEPIFIDSSETSEFTFDTSESNFVIKGTTDIGNELLFNGEEVFLLESEKFNIEVDNLTDGETQLSVIAKNQFGIETEVKINVFKN